jgi:hypothetical protein
MIEWNNSRRDELPHDQQEVIISVNGVNYISTYDSAKRIFRTNELLETFFKVSDVEILWVNKPTQDGNTLQNERSKIYRGKKKAVGSRKK